MKGYEILIFGLFGAGFGIVLGTIHKDINMGLVLLGFTFVMAIAPEVKKKLDRVPA